MATVRYLAMTASEFAAVRPLPSNIGWMACHFSPYGSGLTDLPSDLPRNSLLILNDRIPINGHDRQKIAGQLCRTVERFGCRCILLDFQQSGSDDLKDLTSYLVSTLPCPAAVSEPYALDLTCPVFLSPCPHHIPLKEHLQSWQGREIWLDLALDVEQIQITPEGTDFRPLTRHLRLPTGHADQKLYCHYSIALTEKSASFTLWRTQADVESLAAEAENLGVAAFVGLYQELGLQKS